MEFWEGAVLVAGGVILVAYFTKNKQTAAAAGVAAQTATGSAGTTNASNLTNITNMAGGYPTIAGEPLEPPQPPVGAPQVPVTVSTTPVPTPIKNSPVFGNVPRACPAWGCGANPPRVSSPIGRTVGIPAPVKGTAIISRPMPLSPTAPVVSRPTSMGPVGQPIISRTQTAGTKTTFTQAVPNLPVRPMDQHMEML